MDFAIFNGWDCYYGWFDLYISSYLWLHLTWLIYMPWDIWLLDIYMVESIFIKWHSHHTSTCILLCLLVMQIFEITLFHICFVESSLYLMCALVFKWKHLICTHLRGWGCFSYLERMSFISVLAKSRYFHQTPKTGRLKEHLMISNILCVWRQHRWSFNMLLSVTEKLRNCLSTGSPREANMKVTIFPCMCQIWVALPPFTEALPLIWAGTTTKAGGSASAPGGTWARTVLLAVLPPVRSALPLELAAPPLVLTAQSSVVICIEQALDFLPGMVLPPVLGGSAAEDAPTVSCWVV
jgi:hypothetical protein